MAAPPVAIKSIFCHGFKRKTPPKNIFRHFISVALGRIASFNKSIYYLILSVRFISLSAKTQLKSRFFLSVAIRLYASATLHFALHAA